MERTGHRLRRPSATDRPPHCDRMYLCARMLTRMPTSRLDTVPEQRQTITGNGPRDRPGSDRADDVRRTAVRNLVRSGVSERVAMKLTGDKTSSVFARYDIVSDGDLRDAAVKLDRAKEA
jgi:hypothetical protein